MIKGYVLSLVFLFFIAPVYADNWSWTKEDTARQVIATTLTVIDWGQTNDIVRRDDIIELNPIIGTHPTRKEVDTYFIAVMILQPLIAKVLPRESSVMGTRINPRALWQYIYIGVQTTTVVFNHRLGLRMRF